MQWTEKIRHIKILLVVSAVAIAVASLVVSNALVSDLQEGERADMEVWAEAMRSFNNADENTDLQLVLKVLEGNNTIPLVVLDSKDEVYTYRNLQLSATDASDTLSEVREKAFAMRNANNFIRIDLLGDSITPPDYLEVCYDESVMIHRLTIYPYVQFGVVLIFVLVAIFALLSSRRAEQNKVWVGLSKETAHQLGTPISSLMAWVEVLKESYPEDALIPEMGKDVSRLQRIAERFSKIGSLPECKPENLSEVVEHVVEYIGKRTSNKVVLTTQMPSQPLIVNICAPLFEWVIENLCKNAIDAMEGKGSIRLVAREEEDVFSIEVSDTGKGIAKNKMRTVFKAGYTTKARGWGLGLALCKRIVEQYHNGHVFVKNSELGRGTTFRIELKKH
ncbi:MAG: HAMP domain-containing histidine kinase [Bacteroidaceae bacterium]|nr:HAMP domain-containing histidine kinase [Bacteroidaceae bacterium]